MLGKNDVSISASIWLPSARFCITSWVGRIIGGNVICSLILLTVSSTTYPNKYTYFIT